MFGETGSDACRPATHYLELFIVKLTISSFDSFTRVLGSKERRACILLLSRSLRAVAGKQGMIKMQ